VVPWLTIRTATTVASRSSPKPRLSVGSASGGRCQPRPGGYVWASVDLGIWPARRRDTYPPPAGGTRPPAAPLALPGPLRRRRCGSHGSVWARPGGAPGAIVVYGRHIASAVGDGGWSREAVLDGPGHELRAGVQPQPARMGPTCVSAVRWVITSACAISRLLGPWATSRATLCSRGVRPAGPPPSPGRIRRRRWRRRGRFGLQGSGDRLLERRDATLGPGCLETRPTELRAGHGHVARIRTTVAWRERCANGFAEGLRRAPQGRRPVGTPLGPGHGRESH
jgi:hypothetical protein